MSKIIEGQSDIQLYGWWNANVVVSPDYELTQKKYDEHFDKDMVSFDMAKSLLENGEQTGECLPAYCLNDYERESIKEAILTGNNYGIEGDFSDVPNWEFQSEITLEGAEFDWDDLDDISKEHVINCILDDATKQGELCMSEEFDYRIDSDDISLNDDGIFEGCITINGEDCNFTYDENTVEIESGYEVYGTWNDAPIPVEQIPYLCEDVVSAVKETCEEFEQEQSAMLLPSLDDKLSDAESKVSMTNEAKEDIGKDDFDR